MSNSNLNSENGQKLNVELQQSKPGQLELPKLRKVVREEKEEEKKPDKAELKEVKKTVKKKRASDYALPEIPDYERPELEKYEKSDFDASERVSLLGSHRISISIYLSIRRYQNFNRKLMFCL